MKPAEQPPAAFRAFVFCLCAAFLAGCATASGDESTPAPVTAEASERKKEQEKRFVRDIYQALEDGEVETAEALLVRLLYINPKSPEARLARGEIFLHQGRYAQAAALFTALVSESLLLPRAHQGLGLARLKMGKRELARKALEEAVLRDGDLWRVWNALGYYHDSKREWEAAEKSYNRALKVRRDKASVFNNRGFSKLMQSKYEDALKDFRMALKLNPRLRASRMNIRLAQAWLGRYVEALAGVSDVEMPTVLNNAGYIAMLKGEYATAEAYFSRAMEMSPTFNDVASNNLRKLEAIRSRNQATGKNARR